MTALTIPGHSTEALFAGFAVDAYSLPPAVVLHGSAFVALSAAAAEARTANDAAKAADGKVARLAAIDAAIAYAVEHGAVPDDPTAPLVTARRLAEDAALRLDILEDAAKRERDNLEAVVAMEADTIAAKHLRPAFREIMAAVAKLAPDLRGVDVTSSSSIAAHGPKAGSAYLALVDARARLDAVHAGLEVLRTRAHRGQEDSHLFFRDTRAFPGGAEGRTTTAGRAPSGPPGPLVRLLWLATDPMADAWLPTLTEWDSRYRDWFYLGAEGNRPEAVEAVNAARAVDMERIKARQAASRGAAR